MSQIIESISEVIDNYDAIFCDVWGVVHNGKAAFPEACEALMQARMKGKYVSLVTNSPKTPAWVKQQLLRMQAPESVYDDIVTAGLAMQYSLFATDFKKPYFIGSDQDHVVMTDLPEGVTNRMSETRDYKEADVIICAGPDYGVQDTPEDYAIELQQLWTRKLQMYCGNPDIVVDHGETRIWCGGAIAAAYAKLGGTVFQFGKPYPPIYQLARDRAQNALTRDISPSRILFIGDGVETDLKGAMLEDMDACFVAGGLAAEETGAANGAVDPSLLGDYLSAHQADPLYTISKLRW